MLSLYSLFTTLTATVAGAAKVLLDAVNNIAGYLTLSSLGL